MIHENDYVIFKKADFMKIFQVKKNKPVMIDKSKCKFDNIIHNPSYYGFKYEIKDQQLHLTEHTITCEQNKADIVKDNRNLNDSTKNQKLSMQDIDRLKNMEELSGHEIIDKLIENSASFHDKTEYSQEKYIKKKKEKY
jgi:tRNA (adenine-N(1)-)-methyltransferase non-catalytic subunit